MASTFLKLPLSGSGGGGGGGEDLQATYELSTSPEITTDATRGALTIQRGSAADTDAVIEVKNGTGTTNFAVTGEGTISVATAAATVSRANLNKGTVVLTDAATIATNCALGNVFSVTLGGNRTLGAPTNLATGATYIFIISQDGTGSRTLAYNTVFKFPGGVAPVLTTTASARDILSCVSDGTNLYCTYILDVR